MANSLQSDIILNLRYIRIIRFFLLLIGAWPGERFGENIHSRKNYFRFVLISYKIAMSFGIFNYLHTYLKTETLITAGHIIIILSLSIVILIRVIFVHLNGYGTIVEKFITDFHLLNFKTVSKNHTTECLRVEKACNYLTKVMATVTLSALCVFNMSPMIYNWRNGVFKKNRPDNITIDYVVNYEWFGFNSDDHFYISTFFLGYFNSYLVSTTVVMLDLFMTIIVLHIIGHINILRNSLKIPPPQTVRVLHINDISSVNYAVFDADENKSIQQMLIKCVNHHRIIKRFATESSSGFGPILALNYLYQVLNICVLLFECSHLSSTNIGKYGPLTFMIVAQLVSISVLFEFVKTASSKLMEDVYAIPWESMDVKNQRTVYMLQFIVQTPLQVTALKMVPVGVTTMQQIIKSSLSYYAFLRTKSTF